MAASTLQTLSGCHQALLRGGLECRCNARANQPTLKPVLPLVYAKSKRSLQFRAESSVGSSIITDKTVPEGHKNLHNFLYGEDGEDAHSADGNDRAVALRVGQDDGSDVVGIEEWLSGRESQKLLGLYAVYSGSDDLQYIGYSRHLVQSLQQQCVRFGPEVCAKVRAQVYAKPGLVTRSMLDNERSNWLAKYGTPKGDEEEWEYRTASPLAMTEQQRAEYEDKKMKMQKAMGENLHDLDRAETSDERRQKFLQATENSDWSQVINEQTQETVAQPAPAITSPFSKSTPPSPPIPEEEATLTLTVENVDKALDEVRPYLIADGGDVEVANVSDGVVALRLQGACGTCPSSTTTMKMGIERRLKEVFGSLLKEVVQVDKIDITATVQSVNSHLDMLRPAIQNLGGSVEVLSVENGVCKVNYQGPPPLAMGIKAAIKDRFPDVAEVQL